jgi:hypothetical protein
LIGKLVFLKKVYIKCKKEEIMMVKGIKEFLQIEDVNSRKQIKNDQLNKLRIEEYKNNIF